MVSNIEGRELLDFLEELGELEWQKFETRYPIFHMKNKPPWTEDRSGHPPFTSFRFKNEDKEIIEKLKQALASYHGNVEWMMSCYHKSNNLGINRSIHTKRVADIKTRAENSGMFVWQYMERFEPNFGPVAYEDLKNLVVHFRNFFAAKGTEK